MAWSFLRQCTPPQIGNDVTIVNHRERGADFTTISEVGDESFAHLSKTR